MTAPPIRDGAVEVVGKRIAALKPWRELTGTEKARALDLGEALLMPGLINGHCHLDYTHMAGQIPPPKQFTDWLKVMVSTKAGWTLEDYTASWQEGARMLLRSGTTTVADVEAVPALLPAMWQTTPLRVISFLEMITISRPADMVLAETLQKARALPGGRLRAGLSPHAPYTTVPELLRKTARIARHRKLMLSTHIAESEAEYQMFSESKGEMYEWLRRSGRDMSDCGACSPVRHFAKSGMLGRNLLAAHLNYLKKGDVALVSKTGTSVVHCPRSHFYFKHGDFALRRLLRAGVNVCLGTDSLATVYRRRSETIELSLFAEMQTLHARESSLSASTIVRMATVNGARALQRDGTLGQLSRGAVADLIAIPLKGNAPDPYTAVVQHQGKVLASMIAGTWALPPAL